MRFVGLSSTSDWCIYFVHATCIRRLSRSRWEITYLDVVQGRNFFLGLPYNGSVMIVSCDQAWIEPR